MSHFVLTGDILVTLQKDTRTRLISHCYINAVFGVLSDGISVD